VASAIAASGIWRQKAATSASAYGERQHRHKVYRINKQRRNKAAASEENVV